MLVRERQKYDLKNKIKKGRMWTEYTGIWSEVVYGGLYQTRSL